jgi:hypothetical protein
MSADLVLTDGNILTMNPSQSHSEAVAIRKDRIVKVGANSEVSRWIEKKKQKISLKGRTVVPGFIDTHVHIADFGRFLQWVDLKDVKSIQVKQGRIRERAQRIPKGNWIIGHGWNQTRFTENAIQTS